MTKTDCLALITHCRTGMNDAASDFLRAFWSRQVTFYTGLMPLLED